MSTEIVPSAPTDVVADTVAAAITQAALGHALPADWPEAEWPPEFYAILAHKLCGWICLGDDVNGRIVDLWAAADENNQIRLDVTVKPPTGDHQRPAIRKFRMTVQRDDRARAVPR